jgi:2'-5' RNA ligase
LSGATERVPPVKKHATIYWLAPAKDERELFAEIIRILGKQFDAPNFDPHLTIFVEAKDKQTPAKVLRQIRAAPIRMSVRGIGFSAKFTKTLFVRFKSNRALEKLVVDLAHATESRAKSVRDPHLSLLYKEIPATTQKELASTIRLPFREVVFDSLVAICCTLPVRDRADVEAWRAVATKSLSK